jgi:putative ABC transport system permease protein
MQWPASGLVQDIRFAVRLLAKERWFTLAAVVALALGIGVNSMMMTILNGYYLRGLPVDEPDRVLALGTRAADGRERGVSYPDYDDWRRASRSFDAMGAFAGAIITIADPGRSPDSLGGAYLSPEVFRILRDKAILGRVFLAEDERPGAPPVVLLGYDLWASRYDRDQAIVGQPVIVNGTPATVIGVMPEGFEFPFRHALWQPLSTMPGLQAQRRDERALGVIGRLADGISRAQAGAELGAIVATLGREHPQTNAGIALTMVRFGEQQVGRFANAQPPQALAAMASFILLIACANVANLLLARSAGRSREIAIRASVGATRWRIARQLLVESAMLSFAAGLVGLWLSTFGVRFVATAFGRNAPYWMQLTVDGRVLFALIVVCAMTSVLFGLAPALSLSRTNATTLVHDAGRGGVRRAYGAGPPRSLPPSSR